MWGFFYDKKIKKLGHSHKINGPVVETLDPHIRSIICQTLLLNYTNYFYLLQDLFHENFQKNSNTYKVFSILLNESEALFKSKFSILGKCTKIAFVGRLFS